MRRYLKTICVSALLAALALIPASPAVAGLELPMTTVYMNTHPTVVNAWEPWFQEIAKLTDQEVTLTYFNPNTLTPLADHYDSTISGMIGVGGNDCSRNPGKFNLSTVLEVPGLAPSSECGSLIFWELYKTHPELQKEYEEVNILWLWASATYQIHTTKKQVKTMDDLKGMKIIAWNKTSVDILKTLGANPIQLPPTDSYLALERGMADGVLCPLAPIISFKISDAAKYTTICDLFLNGFWAGMSHDIWNSLSPKAKDAFEKTTGEAMAKKSGMTLDEGAIKDAEKLTASGHTFHVLPEAERKVWLEAMSPLREKWVADMEAKGYQNARGLLEDALKLNEKYAPLTGRGFKQ